MSREALRAMTQQRRRHIRIAWVLGVWMMVAVLQVACGYRFSGGGPLPGDVRRIYVPMLKNRTSESGLEGIVTNALRYEIVRSGLEVSGDGKAADAVLSGEILRAANETIARKTTATAIERRVRITTMFELRDGAGSRVLWTRRPVSADETYYVSSDRTATDQNRKRALEKAAQRLAEKVLASISDDF